ncbi:reverse transcriptase domain-containing protein [Tanacetum coccineum]
MVKEGIVLDHKISKNELEVVRAKVDVITKLPPPTTVKGVRSFLGHAGFYRRFIQDLSKIARPMTLLLEKDSPFVFSDECLASFKFLKKRLTEAPILVSPDWDLPFELMCDASDYVVGAVLGQRKDKYFRPIHYASKTLLDAQTNYTVTEKEILAMVYAFEKFRSYLVLSKTIAVGSFLGITWIAKLSFLDVTACASFVAFNHLRDVLSVIFGLSVTQVTTVMSADSAVTYTSVHSEARSWSIPSEDPYEEAARQLLEQAPRSPNAAEDEAYKRQYITMRSASAPPLPPSFLPSLIRPPRTRAAMAQMRAATPSTYHPLLPLGTPPLLPIPLPAPSTSRRADIPEADTPPRKRLLLTAPRPGCEVGESSAAAARQPGPTMARRVDCSSVDTVETRVRDTERRMMAALEVVNLRKDHAAVRAKIEVLRRERLAYEQESMETRQALARSEAYSRALEARVTVLETQARRHEWQRQDADDRATRHIMRIQALEAGARDDTLEDTGSSA